MKQLTIALIALSMLLSMSACKKLVGTGPVETQIRTHSNFDGINLSLDATVELKQDSFYSVEISAQHNILEVIRTTMTGSELNIGYKPPYNIKSKEPITIRISCPNVHSLNISGSGSIYCMTNLQTDNLKLNISGSGKMNIPALTASSIDANISGSGRIDVLSGTSSSIGCRISGSGDLNLQDVPATTVITNTSGSGNTKVHAVSSLDATISGSGNVYYKGSPVITSQISGSGKIIHIN
ncbi:MAG: DUF2807 domain-containing protein [Chitinophagaceae bacterium]|nr:DUF2807 domain-containing protein [Chitinophagaceae bacterium]